MTLVHRGHAMETMGYWDSGNQLRDPYNHRPVCILSKKVAAKILNPKKDRVHFIPYCSLGQKEGLLPVTEITCIKNSEWKARSRDKTGNGWNCK